MVNIITKPEDKLLSWIFLISIKITSCIVKVIEDGSTVPSGILLNWNFLYRVIHFQTLQMKCRFNFMQKYSYESHFSCFRSYLLFPCKQIQNLNK